MVDVVLDLGVRHLDEPEPEALGRLEGRDAVGAAVDAAARRATRSARGRGRTPAAPPAPAARAHAGPRPRTASACRAGHRTPTSVNASVRSTTCIPVCAQRKSASGSRSATQRATWSRAVGSIRRRFIAQLRRLATHTLCPANDRPDRRGDRSTGRAGVSMRATWAAALLTLCFAVLALAPAAALAAGFPSSFAPLAHNPADALARTADRGLPLRPRAALHEEPAGGNARARALARRPLPRPVVGNHALREALAPQLLAAQRRARDRLAPRRPQPGRPPCRAAPDQAAARAGPRRQPARAGAPHGGPGDHLGLPRVVVGCAGAGRATRPASPGGASRAAAWTRPPHTATTSTSA